MLKLQARHNLKATLKYFLSDKSLSEREKQGYWLGNGSQRAGFDNKTIIAEQDLTQGLRGYSPEGRPMFQHRKPNRRVAWDCVISTDKSVSLAALCLPEEAAKPVKESYQEAVKNLVTEMERLACRQNCGKSYETTGNLIIAGFEHEYSRHNDPHLHTHLLVLNATQDSTKKEKWYSLEPSPIYRHSKILDGIFQRELARHLRLRGISASIEKGIAKIPIPKSICDRFSKAHSVIKRYAKATKPLVLKDMNHKAWENYVNDRNRPQKKPSKSLSSMLTDKEKIMLSNSIQTKREKPLTTSLSPAVQAINEELRKRTLLISQKSRSKAALAASMKMPLTPYSDWANLAFQASTIAAPTLIMPLNLASRNLQLFDLKTQRNVKRGLSEPIIHTIEPEAESQGMKI